MTQRNGIQKKYFGKFYGAPLYSMITANLRFCHFVPISARGANAHIEDFTKWPEMANLIRDNLVPQNGC